jgi:hypothetical protein
MIVNVIPTSIYVSLALAVDVQAPAGRAGGDDVQRGVHREPGRDGRHAVGVGQLSCQLPTRRIEQLHLALHAAHDDAVRRWSPHRPVGWHSRVSDWLRGPCRLSSTRGLTAK